MATTSSSKALFRAATILTLLSVVMGSLVCATGSGMACPTWPGCYPGQLVPGLHLPPWIEFSHRLISAACLVSLVMAALSVWQRKDDPWLVWLPRVAVLGAVAAAAFGMSIIFWGIGPWLGAVDLVCSLIALLAITLASVAAERGGFAWRWTPLTRSGAIVVAGLLIMHALGILVAGPGSFTRCMGWPLPGYTHYDGSESLQFVRLVLAGFVALGVLTMLAVTKARDVWSWVALVLIAAEAGLGTYLLAAGLPTLGKAVYSVLAVVILWAVAVSTAKGGVRGK